MPIRPRCTGCGTGLHHKKKFQVIEITGVASGRKSRQIEQYCEQCYTKILCNKSYKEEGYQEAVDDILRVISRTRSIAYSGNEGITSVRLNVNDFLKKRTKEKVNQSHNNQQNKPSEVSLNSSHE